MHVALYTPLVYGGLRCVRLRLTGRYSIADSPVLKNDIMSTHSSELFMPSLFLCLFYYSDPLDVLQNRILA